jgi:vitamin B12 transporter
MFKPAFAALLSAFCCSATATETTQHAIEHISVYANRSATPQQDVLASVTVLERDDIVARQASDLPALLAQLPGINLSRDGGRGQSSGIFIRGGNTGHTLVLIDGVRTGSATLGYKSLAMLPLELIERIEVVRGPRAAWYGSDALAGVIAITTRRSNAAEINVKVGSYGQAGSDISVSQRFDQLTLRATAGASRADGFTVRDDLDQDRDGYNQQFVNVAADYQTELGLWTAQADVNSGFYEFDTRYGSENVADTLNRAYVLGWQQPLGQWQHQAKLSRHLDLEATFGPDSRSPFVTVRDEFSYQAESALSEYLTLLGGLNWYQEHVERSVAAYEQTSRINRAVFTGLHYQLDAIKLETALRRDLINQYGGQNTWQLAAGYQLAEHWQVRASRGTAFKTPTFNELYYPGYANPALKPQESLADELALRFEPADLTVQLAWFDRDVTNLIQGAERAENVLLATISGVEFSLQQQWQQFSNNLVYTWLDTQNQSNGLTLERRPKHTLHWRGSFAANNWSAFVTMDYQSSTYQGVYASVTNLGGFTLWGIGSAYQLTPELMLRAKLENLFDKNYQTSAGYRTAGANVAISVSYIPL